MIRILYQVTLTRTFLVGICNGVLKMKAPDWRWRPWETFKDHGLNKAGENGEQQEPHSNHALFLQPLGLCMPVPFHLSEMPVLPMHTLAGPSLTPLTTVPLPHEIKGGSKVTLYVNILESVRASLWVHPLHPSQYHARMLKYVLLPATPLLSPSLQLVDWTPEESDSRWNLILWMAKESTEPFRRGGKYQTPWSGKSLDTSAFSFLVSLLALYVPAPTPLKAEPPLTSTTLPLSVSPHHHRQAVRN